MLARTDAGPEGGVESGDASFDLDAGETGRFHQPAAGVVLVVAELGVVVDFSCELEEARGVGVHLAVEGISLERHDDHYSSPGAGAQDGDNGVGRKLCTPTREPSSKRSGWP